ncbi:MAG: porin family protein, partial [bacterium]|nr:porin family protein [bacterium]
MLRSRLIPFHTRARALCGIMLVAALFIPSIAKADDHNGGLKNEPSASANWSGLYGGVHTGIGAFTGMTIDWDRDAFDDPDGDFDQNAFAGVFGLQVGFNHQVGNLVYGLEADIAKTGFSEDRTFDDDHYVKAEMDWLSTIRGRLGLTAGNAMAYVTAGLAIAQLEHCANDDHNNPCSVDDNENIAWDGVKLGLVAGAGVEAALSQNWSFKGEYLFVQMDKENVVYDAG